MESTAQYWRSVWLELEPHLSLIWSQAFSNRAPRGRKHDFKDAERMARRFIARELIMSFVPGEEQRIWRNLTRMKLQLIRDRVRLHCQIECLLEEMQIKLSVVVTDLFGASCRRILHALAQDETDPKNLALLGDDRRRQSDWHSWRESRFPAAQSSSLGPRRAKGKPVRLSEPGPFTPTCRWIQYEQIQKDGVWPVYL